jgi:hypothetical protein
MLNRRQFLGTAAAGLAAAESVTGESPTPSGKAPASGLQDRMYGLLLGGFIGDALGGPIEFQPPEAVARQAVARPLRA